MLEQDWIMTTPVTKQREVPPSTYQQISYESDIHDLRHNIRLILEKNRLNARLTIQELSQKTDIPFERLVEFEEGIRIPSQADIIILEKTLNTRLFPKLNVSKTFTHSSPT